MTQYGYTNFYITWYNILICYLIMYSTLQHARYSDSLETLWFTLYCITVTLNILQIETVCLSRWYPSDRAALGWRHTDQIPQYIVHYTAPSGWPTTPIYNTRITRCQQEPSYNSVLRATGQCHRCKTGQFNIELKESFFEYFSPEYLLWFSYPCFLEWRDPGKIVSPCLVPGTRADV